MGRTLLGRLGGMLAVLSLVSVLVFLLTRLAAGDPIAVLLGDQASLEDIAQARQRYGLDQPLVSQFMLWLGEVLQGNLGQSIFLQMPVTQVLWERVEPTACLAFLSVSLAMLIGVPCGIVSAVWRGRWIDQCVSTLAMLGASMPSFWMGLMVIQLLAVGAGWFPVSGYGDPGAGWATRIHHLMLPALVLGTLNSALIIRFTRASMLDILSEDYIRTARSKGLSESVVVLKHALLNALVPILTVLGLTLALMIGGAVVTETVFNLPGLGNLVVRAVLRRDYPVIQGALLAIAGVYVIINFVIDVMYVFVDPRVRHA
ncbi:peptide ABC transporter [Limnohabitans parvus II-B4]|uniref:Peptide ABC transporter n=1 Tax=Limnohabitans parvus II-B4 TaxID=1293052 RepID=A0A315EJ59_9BURK|nr:peptide ABC transporter [Limnohabitans parvus II-B4]